MFVYVKGDNIIYKSEDKVDFIKGAIVIECGFSLNDNLIFEDGEIRIYEKSKQFEKDIHKYKLNKKIKSLEFQNDKLEKIANDKVEKKMRLKKEATKFEREIYLLNNMKQCGKHL